MNEKIVIIIGSLEFVVLYDGLIPSISEEEYQRLKDDISKNGVLVPIAVDENKGVIDGINRLRAASELKLKDIPFHIHYGLDEKEKRDLALKLNALRRQWTEEKRLDIAIALRKEQYSFRQIGAILNLSHEAVRRYLERLGDTENFPDTTVGSDGIERPSKGNRKPCVVIKGISEAKKTFNELTEIKGQLNLPSSLMDSKTLSGKINAHKQNNIDEAECFDTKIGKSTLLLGDFMEKGNEIADESVDMILTDPPYKKDGLPLWDLLGIFAQRVLKPGGLLLSYSGNMFLPQIHEMLGKHLEYFWTFAVQHTGPCMMVYPVNIQQAWKPIIGYCKPPYKKPEHAIYDMVSGGRSKDNHEWEQPIEEAKYFIENLCPKGGVLLDPLMGSGTAILAGMSLGMNCIGIDIDTTAFATAKIRVGHFNKNSENKAA